MLFTLALPWWRWRIWFSPGKPPTTMALSSLFKPMTCFFSSSIHLVVDVLSCLIAYETRYISASASPDVSEFVSFHSFRRVIPGPSSCWAPASVIGLTRPLCITALLAIAQAPDVWQAVVQLRTPAPQLGQVCPFSLRGGRCAPGSSVVQPWLTL